MSDKTIPLTEKQGKHIESIMLARQSIERDLQNAVNFAAAGEDLDVPEGAQFRYEQNPPRIVVTLPDEPDESYVDESGPIPGYDCHPDDDGPIVTVGQTGGITARTVSLPDEE